MKMIFFLPWIFIASLFGKVYDCFPFFNEFEILEIRLNELYDYVDKFVIVECSLSHRGLPKPFNFETRQDLFNKFADKITYIKVDETTPFGTAFERETFQKNQIMRGLTECRPDDVILFGDVDEIPVGSMIPQLVETVQTSNNILALRQKFFRHYLNRRVTPGNTSDNSDMWVGTLVMKYDQLTDTPDRTPSQRRLGICFEGIRVNTTEVDCGWHFSSMGGFERFLYKNFNWAHFGNSYPMQYDQWLWEVHLHRLVPIDETYPKFVQENVNYLIRLGLIDPPTI